MIHCKKNILLPVLVLGAALLTGCEHKNPLIETRHAKTIPGLVKACTQAETKLGVKEAKGWAYYYCMEKEKRAYRIDCDALFNLMVSFAQDDPVLKGMTRADLTSEMLFDGLTDDYFSRLFNRSPG